MIELPDPQSPEGVSDWIELYASLSQERVQRGLVSAAIRGALGTEPSDDFIAEVWLETATRARSMLQHLTFSMNLLLRLKRCLVSKPTSIEFV